MPMRGENGRFWFPVLVLSAFAVYCSVKLVRAHVDPKVDARRLDSRLVSCAGDASASSAARVMAVQLCGEHGIAASRPLLRRLVADTATPAPLKMAAEWSLRALDGKVVAQ